jgi:hypothetical protein
MLDFAARLVGRGSVGGANEAADSIDKVCSGPLV